MSAQVRPILDSLIRRDIAAANVCRNLARACERRHDLDGARAHEKKAQEHERLAVELRTSDVAMAEPERLRETAERGPVDIFREVAADRMAPEDGAAILLHRMATSARERRRLTTRRLALACAGGLVLCALVAWLSACGPAGAQEPGSAEWKTLPREQRERIIAERKQADAERRAAQPVLPAPPVGLTVYHDDARGVTCWIVERKAEKTEGYGSTRSVSVSVAVAIDCIPDAQIATPAPERSER